MSDTATTLGDIRSRTHEILSLGAHGSKLLGGQCAARAYLNDSLVWWLGLAIAQEGEANAIQMLEDAYIVATHVNGSDHGRCAP